MKRQNLIHFLIGIVCIGLLPGAQAVVPPPFAVGAATHETRADSQAALQLPNASEISAAIESVSSAPSTRSSFMADWDDVAGATGYLLDVSTSDSFSDYVDGYHDLDVGNVTGRVVTGLNPGTTYYYRVRPYTTLILPLAGRLLGSYDGYDRGYHRTGSYDHYDGGYHRADHSRDVRLLHYLEPKRGGDRGDD